MAVPKGQGNAVKVKSAFTLHKGDSSLTEAIIYAQQDTHGMPVHGGGEALPRFKISKASKTKKGVGVTMQKGPAIIVAMDGSSGTVRVVEGGEFCCNHHACVLVPKPEFGADLFAVAQQLEGGAPGYGFEQRELGNSYDAGLGRLCVFAAHGPHGPEGARRQAQSDCRNSGPFLWWSPVIAIKSKSRLPAPQALWLPLVAGYLHFDRQLLANLTDRSQNSFAVVHRHPLDGWIAAKADIGSSVSGRQQSVTTCHSPPRHRTRAACSRRVSSAP